MKKRIMALLLVLAVCLSLPPIAYAAEETLPDWYFLFAIFKSVDADCTGKDGAVKHLTSSMTQDEIDIIRDNALAFEKYMNQLGVARAHVEVVEIDTVVTELGESAYGSWVSSTEAYPLLKGKVDLDRYDHVFCAVCLDVDLGYGGLTGAGFENGTGHSCINYRNRDWCLNYWAVEVNPWAPGYPVHEFLHFMNQLSAKWGGEFDLHDIMSSFYERVNGEFEECYTDILLNQAKGTAGTGVHPAVWQYSPHVLRTMSELTVPSSVASIGGWAFASCTTLTRVSIPAGVASIGGYAFAGCSGLTEVTISSSISSIEDWTFGSCPALTRISIPASVASIGYASFWDTGLKDVYYGGTEEQWKAIQIGDYNGTLTNAAIHYNSLMADVKTTDWFAQSVTWALENGVTNGTGNGTFSPSKTCTQGEILTFLWRAMGEPEPAEAVNGGKYYAKAAQWAKEQGLTDDFSAEADCTRAMVVTYLWKLAGSPGTGRDDFSDVPFADVTLADAPAVSWASELGITGGTGANTFSPERTCSRAEIVTFLYRFMLALTAR